MTTSEILSTLRSADDSTRREVFLALSRMMVSDIQKTDEENARMSAQLIGIISTRKRTTALYRLQSNHNIKET